MCIYFMPNCRTNGTCPGRLRADVNLQVIRLGNERFPKLVTNLTFNPSSSSVVPLMYPDSIAWSRVFRSSFFLCMSTITEFRKSIWKRCFCSCFSTKCWINFLFFCFYHLKECLRSATSSIPELRKHDRFSTVFSTKQTCQKPQANSSVSQLELLGNKSHYRTHAAQSPDLIESFRSWSKSENEQKSPFTKQRWNVYWNGSSVSCIFFFWKADLTITPCTGHTCAWNDGSLF